MGGGICIYCYCWFITSMILFSVGQLSSRVYAIVFPNLIIMIVVAVNRATSKATLAEGFFRKSGVESFMNATTGFCCFFSSSASKDLAFFC